MIASPNQFFLSPEEYLSYEEDSPFKHEYIDGEIYAMAGTTDTHNIIAGNLFSLIRNHLRGTDCRTFFADIKAKIESKNCFYYPDLLVTCNPNDRETSTYKCFPKLIIEVLSDSTEAFDRGDKFNDYQTLPSLEEYILVNSKHQRLEIVIFSFGSRRPEDALLDVGDHPVGAGPGGLQNGVIQVLPHFQPALADRAGQVDISNPDRFDIVVIRHDFGVNGQLEILPDVEFPAVIEGGKTSAGSEEE